MFVRANFVDIYLEGMRDRSMRSGTELAWEIKLTDWWMAGNLSNLSSGVQIPRDICTRLKHYLYSAKRSWIIKYNTKQYNTYTIYDAKLTLQVYAYTILANNLRNVLCLSMSPPYFKTLCHLWKYQFSFVASSLCQELVFVLFFHWILNQSVCIFSLGYFLKQKDCILPNFCSVNHRRCQEHQWHTQLLFTMFYCSYHTLMSSAI